MDVYEKLEELQEKALHDETMKQEAHLQTDADSSSEICYPCQEEYIYSINACNV